MEYELTQQEKDTIDGMAASFWADLKVTTHVRIGEPKNAVMLYVQSHRTNFDYPTCLGLYDNPAAVKEAVLKYPGYVNRSTTSAADMVSMGRYYKLLSDSEIFGLCENAVKYWQENYASA